VAARPPPGCGTLSLHAALPIFPPGVEAVVIDDDQVDGTVGLFKILKGLVSVFAPRLLRRGCGSWGGFRGAQGSRAHDVQFDSQRSEEHTSELQSRENLVCRLLL